MSLGANSQSGVEEAIHGVVVRDPYRWLEDGNSSETKTWIADQQRRFEEYYATTEDLDIIRERVREYLDVEIVDQPTKFGDRYFYRRRDIGCEQPCIYVRDVSTGLERLLVDPSTRGRFVSVAIHCLSLDGALLAYELKRGGADILEIHIVDVQNGAELPDIVEAGYSRGFSFAEGQQGFYYCQEPVEHSGDHVIRFHRFGEIGLDRGVYQVSRSVGSRLALTSDEVHLGTMWEYLSNGEPVTQLAIARRDAPLEWKTVLTTPQWKCRPFLKHGRIFAISLNEAPNGKLIELNGAGYEIRLIIPEQAGTIQQLVFVGDLVVLTYLYEWGMIASTWTISGNYIERLDVPADGTVRLLQSRISDPVFCTYESFNEPLKIYEFNPETGKLALWYQQQVPVKRTGCDARPGYVFSKDGTRIPLMLISHRDFAREAPTIMTGYGGFGTAVTPQYSVLVSIMLELGSTFVLSRIRGGGEFGIDWRDAGRQGKRQNAFDDFIASAEWLSSEGIVAPGRLAIFGGSNAGLLVAAVLTQRPELFGAVLCIAPLLDMVRYEQFDQAARWRYEYGTVSNAEDFNALFAYSPYHHVEDDHDYPPVLFISGDSDDRCNPAHVRKMAARLQQRKSQTRPVVVDYSRARGHSPVLPLSVRIESLARRITFLCKELNINVNGCSQ